MFEKQIKDQINILETIKKDIDLISNIEKSINLICSSIEKKLPLLVFGNGGSASDALHITAELVGRFLLERKPINVICLNSNTSTLTALSNDYDYNIIFERQIEAHAIKDGVCLGISTSGKSVNIINAFKKAKILGMKTIALTGNGGGKLFQYSDIMIEVPSTSTPRIQEIHLPIYHYMCEQIEKHQYRNEKK